MNGFLKFIFGGFFNKSGDLSGRWIAMMVEAGWGEAGAHYGVDAVALGQLGREGMNVGF